MLSHCFNKPVTCFISVLLCAFIALPQHLTAQVIELPDIGESAAGVATPTEERQTGEAVVRNIRRAGGIIDDALLNEYINHLGYRLVSTGNSQITDFHFFIVNDKNINAFALPGGFIGLHYGLILATQSESELASVVAHEIAHVTQRHHARAYDFGGNSSVPVLAAIIAAMILGANNNELGEAAMASLAAGNIQQQINFTRSNEKEADHIGIELLATSGFDPHSMASFFETLHKATRLYGPQAPEFLSTHPVNETRIADAKNRADHYPRMKLNSQKNYQLMRARLRVLVSTDLQQTQARMALNLKQGSFIDEDAERYGYILTLLENGQPRRARQELHKLITKDPQRIAYLLLRAQLESKLNNDAKAINYYEQALRIYPDNPTLTLDYAKALIGVHRADQARILLKDYLRASQENPAFFQLLAEAETQLGHASQAQIAMGEYYYHTGRTHQAITQLSMALKDKKLDFYDASRVEARLNEFKVELSLLHDRSRSN